MEEPRLRWNGNQEAQKQADEAFAKLRDKPKSKPKKKKRNTPAYHAKQRRHNAKRGRVQYREYMVSKQWKNRRRRAIKFYGAKCQSCERTGQQLYVHHKTYKHLGHEPMEDLEVLCLFCHEDRHADKVLPTDPISRQFVAMMQE